MTARNALVAVSGVVQELPAGDTLNGAGGSAPPCVVNNGVTFAVAANTQVFARNLLIAASGEVTIAGDAELIFA